MNRPRSRRTLVLLAPAVFLILWSSGFSAVKLGLHFTGPLTFLAVRYLLVLALLLPLLLVLRPPPPAGRAWVHLAVVGALVQFGYFALVNVALQLGASAAAVALVVSLQPILVAILAPRLVGERVSVLRWVGLLIGLTGAAIVILARSELRLSPIGILAAVGSLSSFTAGTMYEKRFGIEQHPVTANFVQYVAALLIALPVALVTERMHAHWTPTLVLVLVYLAVANSLVSVTLLLAMIRRGEATRVSSLFFLVPPLAALIAWILLGDELSPLAWAGMAVAAGGVALALRPTLKAAAS